MLSPLPKPSRISDKLLGECNGTSQFEGLRKEIDGWRTRLQPIRTSAEITARIRILPVHQPYLYQKLSKKATELRLLGMPYQQIAKSLNINKRTVMRACKYKAKN